MAHWRIVLLFTAVLALCVPVRFALAQQAVTDPAGAAEEAVEKTADPTKNLVENATKLPEWDKIDVQKMATELVPAAAAIAIRTLGVLLLLFLAWLVARWVRRLVAAALKRARAEETISKFLTQLAGWAVLVLALVLCLGIYGVNTTAFAAVFAALGLAIGLGFQGALSNIAAGVLLLVFKPFRVGDLVEIDGELGIVEEIELYFTRINQFDNKHVIIPNDDVLGNKIENISHNKTRRIDVPIGVTYSADPDETRKALEAAIPKIDKVIKHDGNTVVFMGYGDSSVNWEVRVFCEWRDWLIVTQSTLREIWYALKDADITIPFPQRDLHVPGAVRVQLETRPDDSSTSTKDQT